MKIDIKNNKLIINGNKIDDTKQYIKDLYVDLFANFNKLFFGVLL